MYENVIFAGMNDLILEAGDDLCGLNVSFAVQLISKCREYVEGGSAAEGGAGTTLWFGRVVQQAE